MTTLISNSYPLWNGSLKRDIQGFKPGMTESEAKQALSDCEVSGHKILCPVASKDERFELSLTGHTRPRLVKEDTLGPGPRCGGHHLCAGFLTGRYAFLRADNGVWAVKVPPPNWRCRYA